MIRQFSIFLRPLYLICLLIGVAGCTPSYVNTEDLGTRSTEAEIRDHYSGNSIRYAQKPEGPINTEAYFAPDGTYKMVALDGTPIFSIGTWSARKTSLLIKVTDYYVDRDGSVSQRNAQYLSVIYIQPDGRVNADLMGGGNFEQPRPTPGFQAERRFNELRRQAGL